MIFYVPRENYNKYSIIPLGFAVDIIRTNVYEYGIIHGRINLSIIPSIRTPRVTSNSK